MGPAAVVVAAARAVPAPAQRRPNPDTEAQLSSLRRQLGYGRKFRPRRTLALIALVLVLAWVVIGFGRTITALNEATNQQTALMAETAALSAQLDAAQRELVLAQTEAYQVLQARAYGLGAPGEIAFSLEAGAPDPRPVTPLGAEGLDAQPQTPLDAWLRLLFGD